MYFPAITWRSKLLMLLLIIACNDVYTQAGPARKENKRLARKEIFRKKMAALADSIAKNRASFDSAAAATADTAGSLSTIQPPVKKEKARNRSFAGWMIAGAFLLILLFVAGRRKKKGEG